MADAHSPIESNNTLSMDRQNQMAADDTAKRFLTDVSTAVNHPVTGGDYARIEASETFDSIRTDVDQQRILGAIAKDIDDSQLMASLNMRGSVRRDASGEIRAIEFNPSDPNASLEERYLYQVSGD